jgi:ADP-ribose pyrophosphatase YjhB (NUDIX family)
MNFDPQKFFIGLLDFFSILLPGALLTYLLMDELGPVVLGDRYSELAAPEAWAAFLFASYLLGHLVFLLGSWLDEFYDWARRYTLNTQITLLARRGRPLRWPARALVWLVFKRERNLAVDRATRIKQQALGALQAKDAINTFQWCKALLSAESPESLAVVQRFEADSKFFRCFAVVLLVLLAAWPFQDKWPPTGIPVVLGLLLLALWRYMEQRNKASNQAYWSVMTLTAKDSKIALEKRAPAADSPTHAGGVVFRVRRNYAEYLLVEAKDDPTQWVLPKGHVEEGEQHRETAVREVFEETGVWARVGDELGDVSYAVKETPITVHFFVMQAAGRGLPKDKDRRHVWLTFDKAIARASHPETRELLQVAHDLFDRRYKIYEATRKFLGLILHNATFTDSELAEFDLGISDVEFLFRSDVVEYLAHIRKQAIDMRTDQKLLSAAREGTDVTERAQAENERLVWLNKQVTVMTKVFSPYLGFGHVKEMMDVAAVAGRILKAFARPITKLIAWLWMPDIKERRVQYDELRRRVSYVFQQKSGFIFSFAVPEQTDELNKISEELKDLADQLSSSIGTFPKAVCLLVLFRSKTEIGKASSLLRGVANMNVHPQRLEPSRLRCIDNSARQIQRILGVSLGMK